MNRREFLRTAGAVSAGLVIPDTNSLFAEESRVSRWRKFEVMTHVEVLKPSGPTRVWVPTALVGDTPFQRTVANTFTAEGGHARVITDKTDALGMIAAEFPAGVKPKLEITSRVTTSPSDNLLS